MFPFDDVTIDDGDGDALMEAAETVEVLVVFDVSGVKIAAVDDDDAPEGYSGNGSWWSRQQQSWHQTKSIL